MIPRLPSDEHALLDAKDGKLVVSTYAKNAKQAGLSIITWSLEPGALWRHGHW